METLETTLQKITDALQSLEGAPAISMVLIACLAFGYLLKVIPSFPNKAIPMAAILFGALLYPIIADANNEIPLRVWLVRNTLIGLVIGVVAWTTHRLILSKLEEKFGLFTKGKGE